MYTFNQIFGSINAHNKIQASRRDDIESLMYMIIYLKSGKLPWTKQLDVILCLLSQKGIKVMLMRNSLRRE
jgi:hypothetical protein